MGTITKMVDTKITDYEGEDTEITDNFESGFEDDLRDICGVVYVLPAEFAEKVVGIEELEAYFEESEEFHELPVLVNYMYKGVKPLWNSVFLTGPETLRRTI